MKTPLILAVLAICTQIVSANAQSQSTSAEKIYTGLDAINKEIEIIDAVIAETSKRVVEGRANKQELSDLVDRHQALKLMLSQPERTALGGPETISKTITGCGQALTLEVAFAGTPGGIYIANARANVMLDSTAPAFVEGAVYTIAKNSIGQRPSTYSAFRYNSAKLPSGFYPIAISSGTSLDFSACSKAYATGAITAGGNPLVCGNTPVFIEIVRNSNGFPAANCDLP